MGKVRTQCVIGIRLRPITPINEVSGNSVKMDDFQQYPNLGKNHSEHEIFDSALQQLFHERRFIKFPTHCKKAEYSVLNEVRSLDPQLRHQKSQKVVATARAPVQADALTVLHGAGEGFAYSPPPTSEPEVPVEPTNLFFPKPNLKMTPAHVYNDNSQLGVPTLGNVSFLTEERVPSLTIDSWRTDAR